MAKPPKKAAARVPAKKRRDRRGAPKGHSGVPPFEATAEQRIRVEAMVTAGATQAFIAEELGISEDTLQRHFRTELDQGKSRVIAKIGASMVKKALDGDHDAQKYTLARIGGWKTGTELSGPNGGPIEYRSLSDEELDARIAALSAGAATASED